MPNKISEIFPAQSLIFILMCGAAIILFIFFIIIPSQKAAAELDSKIEELEKRIGEQRTLTPVFHSLLNKAKAEDQTKLPVTQKAKMARGDMTEVFDQIKAIAKWYNLKLEEITPDVNSLKGGSGYLLIHLVVTGDFFKFREFLIDLGAIPSLAHVEEMRINAIEESREIKLKIWLAQE
jgi:Tfp pilus assembly protein PilO